MIYFVHNGSVYASACADVLNEVSMNELRYFLRGSIYFSSTTMTLDQPANYIQ